MKKYKFNRLRRLIINWLGIDEIIDNIEYENEKLNRLSQTVTNISKQKLSPRNQLTSSIYYTNELEDLIRQGDTKTAVQMVKFIENLKLDWNNKHVIHPSTRDRYLNLIRNLQLTLLNNE
ncbi:hypothetical protein [Tenacibaculum agarivorans]|uniref:hypothetical protein n=1 Tax=Tenacibaculum agarivorans TaxID=1908389 RepID=UPI000A6F646A|nr:hypothetical protein [Tenacibaculum agarivorans]